MLVPWGTCPELVAVSLWLISRIFLQNGGGLDWIVDAFAPMVAFVPLLRGPDRLTTTTNLLQLCDFDCTRSRDRANWHQLPVFSSDGDWIPACSKGHGKMIFPSNAGRPVEGRWPKEKPTKWFRGKIAKLCREVQGDRYGFCCFCDGCRGITYLSGEHFNCLYPGMGVVKYLKILKALSSFVTCQKKSYI